MTTQELFQWAHRHHYPYLIIRNDGTRREMIRHGEVAWWVFIQNASAEQLARAEARVRMWDRYEQGLVSS